MTKFNRRECPVCGVAFPRFLFRQEFESFAEKSLLNGYDIVYCQGCGGIYADHIPRQSYFDEYYDKLSKYERHGGNLSKIDIERFRDIADKLADYAPSSIADIGCATGGLLSELKARGLSNLHGFDQSASCVNLARNRGIPASQLSIMNVESCGQRFDLVTCTSVLEHVREVGSAMQQIKAILNPEGHLYLEVPDVSRYKDVKGAGFALFSTEHINYFSESSMRMLLALHGFTVSWILHIDRQLSEKSIEPTLSVLCRLTDKPEEPKPDFNAIIDVMAYIEKSKWAEKAVCHKTLNSLCADGVQIIVWGAGTHTQRLLATTALKDCNILGIVDSNEHYQGLTLRGIKIQSPETLRRAHWDAFVLISSEIWQDEIEAQIREMDETRRIIKLYC